jgi:nicotine blue oxidoreductase
MGGPKGLLRLSPTGPSLVELAVTRLRHAGLEQILVVVGSAAPNVTVHAERAGATVVEAPDWDEGMGASLRRGLEALEDTDARAALLMLVDLPDVGADVHSRLLATLDGDASGGPDGVIARAAYDGRAGHPVLLGRDHWKLVVTQAVGDRGARDYFDTHPPQLVECGDLATGRDIDRPGDV